MNVQENYSCWKEKCKQMESKKTGCILAVLKKSSYHKEKKKIMGISMKKNKRKNKKKRMSYRKKIVMLQIGAISLAFFLLIFVGAAVLTKIFVGEADNSKTVSSQDVVQEQEGSAKEQTEPVENDTQEPETSKEAETEEEPETISPVEEVKITVSMIGDCTIGTDEFFAVESNFDAFYIVKKDLGYFFQNVRDILSADDLTIANMEGTLTESTNRQDKTYAFKGSPKYTEILTSGSVEATNLANNHSKDYGEESYTDTIQYLEEAGITTFGYERTAVVDVKGIKVGLVGIYELASGLECKQQMITNIDSVIAQGAQAVIVSFHWGSEKETYPDDIQKELAHAAIDHGADLVVGHHPHVLQGIEEYNGKNIVYSLGNFCFGGNRNPQDKDTMIFQQTFTFENGNLVADNVTNIIPCSISSVQQYNDYCPTPLEGTEKERVLQKITELSSGLSS